MNIGDYVVPVQKQEDIVVSGHQMYVYFKQKEPFKAPFTTWIKKQLGDRFKEDTDFDVIYSKNANKSKPGRKKVDDYALTLNTAMHIGMMIDWDVRQWFIDKEKELRSKNKYSFLFAQRYSVNIDQVKKGYFSVIGELFVRLHSKFEMVGYIIPDKAFDSDAEIRPDVSVGRGFAEYIKEKYPDHQEEYSYYDHKFLNGCSVKARMYSNKMIYIFIEYVENIWIPENAAKYFKARCPEALEYLPKLLKK